MSFPTQRQDEGAKERQASENGPQLVGLPKAVDYLIVGSGLTGAVMARVLADAGRDVHLVERRSHYGGNVHDFLHPSGVRVHLYGPHTFRTSSARIWNFVNRFSPFYRYEAVVKSFVEGALQDWPITVEYLRREFGENWRPGFQGRPQNFEQAALSKMPAEAYHSFVQGYTEKQWGVPARSLSSELASRFQLGTESDPRLMKHKYQGLPTLGYAGMMTNMLAGLPVTLETDFLQHREAVKVGKLLIFTGAIDEYYGHSLGRLQYRGQQREVVHDASVDQLQSVGQVNYPSPDVPYIRVIEWKHYLPDSAALTQGGTVYTREIPYSPDSPGAHEYPFPSADNRELYHRYRSLADAEPNVLIAGRLGEYRYYDMDQAIGRALKLVNSILGVSDGRDLQRAGSIP